MGFVRYTWERDFMIVASPLCAEVAPAPVFDVPQVGVALPPATPGRRNGQTMRFMASVVHPGHDFHKSAGRENRLR